MSAARRCLSEAVDQALQAAGVGATAEQVETLVEAVADSLEVIAGDTQVFQEVERCYLPRAGGGAKRLEPWWSRTTLEGLAYLLRRR